MLLYKIAVLTVIHCIGQIREALKSFAGRLVKVKSGEPPLFVHHDLSVLLTPIKMQVTCLPGN